MVSLKILLLEDDPDDVLVISRALGMSPFFKPTIEVADQASTFVNLLDSFEPDVILSDYRLPQFSGLEALEICIVKKPESPFIFVTGAIGEELAAETVLNGAWGFVLKSNLDKLNPLINESFLLSRRASIPKRISSLISTSSRVRRQIEINNKILDRARELVSNQNKNDEKIQSKIHEELEQSQREIQKLLKDLKTNPDDI